MWSGFGDVRDAAGENNAGRRVTTALGGHLEEDAHGKADEDWIFSFEIDAALGNVDRFSGLATLEGRVHGAKDERDFEIKAGRKTAIGQGRHLVPFLKGVSTQVKRRGIWGRSTYSPLGSAALVLFWAQITF